MKEKFVPQLDERGYVIGVVIADPSPLEPDVYLIPGYAVDAEPPVVPAGMRAKWNGSGFDFEEILRPGHVPVPTTEEIKASVWDRIKYERDCRTENGGYKVGDKWFHSDQKSRSQQLGLVLLGASIPAGLQWKTMDGSFVTMTQQLAGQVLAAAAASDQAIFAAAEAHRQAMEASADPSAYDFSTGWPKVFGE